MKTIKQKKIVMNVGCNGIGKALINALYQEGKSLNDANFFLTFILT